MKKFKIIIDSTTDIITNHPDVITLPIIIRFGEEEYYHGVNLSNQAFYQKLAESEVFPTTSQVTPHAFSKQCKSIVEAGEQVLIITCSKKFSGTYQSALIAAAEYPEDVWVVDSHNVAIGAGILVEYALKCKDAGKTIGEIYDALLSVRDRIRIVAALDTLEYLKRGGRISKTTAFVGGVLNMKPLLCIENGVVASIGKARGNKQAYTMLLSEVEKVGGIDFAMPFMFGYTGTDDLKLQSFIQESRSLQPSVEVLPQTIVGSAVGVHAGPGAVTIAFFTH